MYFYKTRMPIGPATPYGDKELGQYMDSGNGLVLEGTKPLPGPMLTDHM